MEIDQAVEIMKALSQGIDPLTHEPYPDGSPLLTGQTLEALGMALSALEKEQVRSVRRRELPSNAGVPWSDEETAMLVESFDAGKTIEELAVVHGRTPGAIRSRLLRLGRLQIEEPPNQTVLAPE